MTKTKPLRVEGLDAARGIASTLVVIHHILRCTPPMDGSAFWKTGNPQSTQWWVGLAFLGDPAVTLFFVLSGTSLALSLMNRVPDWKNFFRRRFFRIYPAYFACILIYFLFRPVYLALAHPPYDDWLSHQFTIPIDWKAWLSYLTMTSNIFGPEGAFNVVLWSLPIEMQFYLFMPVLFVLGTAKRPLAQRWLIVVGLAVLGLALERVLHVPGKTLTRLWEFAGGVMLGVTMSEKTSLPRNTLWGIGIAGALGFLWLRLGLPVPARSITPHIIEVLCMFALVLLVLNRPDWKGESGLGKFAVNVGVWSYGLYLIHNLVLGVAAPLVARLGLPTLTHLALLSVIVLPTSIALSFLVYRSFELPMMKLGRSRIPSAG